MKIINCYVSSFGKLKDFSFDFTDGLNTVKHDNGWGKSTFASFIKSMFYGLDDSKRGIDDNERKKFAPWNSTEKFGGNLTFEWKGGKYKIERFFGAKSSEDAVKLYDLSTNKVYTEGKAVENLGKRVFSIDEEGFLSTTYFSQKDFEIKSNTSITAKFNEVCEIQDSDAFDNALFKLDGKIKELKSRGDKGRIADLKRSLVATEENIERAKQSVKTIESLKTDLGIIKGESETLGEKIKSLTERVEAAGKREAAAERKKRYDALNAEIAELNAEKSRAEKVLNDKTVTEQQVDDCEKCIRDLYDMSVKKETLKKDLEDYAPQAKVDKAPKIPKLLFIVLAVACVLFACGIILAFTAGLWGLSFAVAGVIAALISFAYIVSSRKKYFDLKTSDGKLAEIYERKKRAFSECEESERKLERGLDEYFSAFGFSENNLSYQQKLNLLKDAVKMRDECDRAIEKRSSELKSLSDFAAVNGGDTESVSELNEQLKIAADWYKNKISEAERIKSRIDALENASDSLLDIENRGAELKEQLKECEKELKILTLTAEFLNTADEALKIRYRTPLQDSLNKYIGKISGADISVAIDTDMKVSVNVAGAERETEFFSKGYRNLFEICKRFALTDILFTVEKPFIILDDPFYNLDDGKTVAALELVKQLSAEYQIIYLVCHESRIA